MDTMDMIGIFSICFGIIIMAFFIFGSVYIEYEKTEFCKDNGYISYYDTRYYNEDEYISCKNISKIEVGEERFKFDISVSKYYLYSN